MPAVTVLLVPSSVRPFDAMKGISPSPARRRSCRVPTGTLTCSCCLENEPVARPLRPLFAGGVGNDCCRRDSVIGPPPPGRVLIPRSRPSRSHLGSASRVASRPSPSLSDVALLSHYPALSHIG